MECRLLVAFLWHSRLWDSDEYQKRIKVHTMPPPAAHALGRRCYNLFQFGMQASVQWLGAIPDIKIWVRAACKTSDAFSACNFSTVNSVSWEIENQEASFCYI